MDWRAVNFELSQARTFLVTVDEHSLSAAARALGLTQPTVGRQVRRPKPHWESSFSSAPAGASIRHPQGWSLPSMPPPRAPPPCGFRRRDGPEPNGGRPDLHRRRRDPRRAPSAPILAELRSAYPGIEAEIVATNAVGDPHRREADIAVCNARPDDPDLFGRHVADDRATLFAAPQYVDRLGDTVDAAHLSGADVLGFDSTRMLVDGLHALALNLAPGNVPLLCKNRLVLRETAKAGLGIGILPAGLGRREPGPVEVLPALPPISHPVRPVSHGELKTSRTVRLVFGHIARAPPRILAGRAVRPGCPPALSR